jgi:hypothetical protein
VVLGTRAKAPSMMEVEEEVRILWELWLGPDRKTESFGFLKLTLA